jgi:hypothetical protein
VTESFQYVYTEIQYMVNCLEEIHVLYALVTKGMSVFFVVQGTQ